MTDDVAAGFPADLHPSLLAEVSARGFSEPTPVQREVLDPKRAGRDLLVSSQTGSGKTVAFGLVASDALTAMLDGQPRLPHPKRHQPPSILVVAPTRELALQVQRELEWLYAGLGAKVASCVGGVDINRERRALYGGVHVVVGTPGRLVDHLTRGSLDLSALRCVVLDEADEMLDMGFRDELEAILQGCPASPPEGNRRTLLFSATLPPAIVELARKYQRDATRVVATPATAHQDIEVRAHLVASDEREHAVVNVLRFHEPVRALVFVALRETVTRLQARLVERGFAAVGLSGELSQAERTRALDSLRAGRARVLVATDVAARGLDLPEVSLVIHGDVANDPVSMTHRNGRTGRAGRKGTAVILATQGSQRAAEMQMLAVGARVQWTPLPAAHEVHEADRKRLLARVADDIPLVEADDREMGKKLLEEHGADEVAAVLARKLREALPQPEEVANSLALKPDAPRGRKPFRPKGRFDNKFDNRRGPPPRDRDRGPPREDRGPPREDRGPPREDRRPPQRDDRPPPREDRRPPQRDDRPPPREDRRPPPRGDDRRPPPRDDRRPPPRGDDRRPPPRGGGDRPARSGGDRPPERRNRFDR